jgi:ribose-phosphate pyrophosphokinase
MSKIPVKIIDGSANSPLVEEICTFKGLKRAWSKTKVSSFSDGETNIEIQESMRGADVFVIQPTSPPANEHFIQLCFILDALKRSSCHRITAVIPYFGYGRQDKKLRPRVPISARAIADIIQCVGVDRVLTMDLHANQIQGFFSIPVDNLFSSSIFMNHMEENLEENTVFVSPDVGGVARTVHYSKKLKAETAIIHKTRVAANKVGKMVLLGDVRNKVAIIVDDMIDTAGTLCKAAGILKDAGAKKIIAYGSHGIFSGNAHTKIYNSDFDKIYITDSIQKTFAILPSTTMIETISCAELFAKAILNIHEEISVSSLFS